jgi:hypothetical protein
MAFLGVMLGESVGSLPKISTGAVVENWLRFC